MSTAPASNSLAGATAVQKYITPTMDHIDLNALPTRDNDEQPFQHNIDHIKVSTLESTIHKKYMMSNMMSNMHGIDLNSSPLADNDEDEPQFEDHFNYMQGASTSKSNNKGDSIDVAKLWCADNITGKGGIKQKGS